MAEAAKLDDLRPGDHACLTFTDGEERLDLVAAFVRDGLRGRQKVLCVTDARPQPDMWAQLADRGLAVADAAAARQLSVLDCAETYLAGGSFAAARMLGFLTAEIERAQREGFAGLRITSDMCWALRPVTGVEELMAYESRATQLFAEAGATAVCQYDRQCFDPVTLASAAAHHRAALAAVTYHDDALLRICRQHQPPGVRVSGEIDYRGVEPLGRALAEALALDDHLHVNLVGLDFVDGSAGGAVLQAAAGLRSGQRMTVRCRSTAGKLFGLLGLEELPGVTVAVTIDDD